MSISFNRVVQQGRITANPELKTTQNGISFVQFTLAVDRPYQKGKERQTDFIRCIAWRQSAQFLCQYGKKGYTILVEGSLQPNYYEKSGVKIEGYNVLAESVEIDFPPKSASTSDDMTPSQEPSQEPSPNSCIYQYEQKEDDDLPF